MSYPYPRPRPTSREIFYFLLKVALAAFVLYGVYRVGFLRGQEVIAKPPSVPVERAVLIGQTPPKNVVDFSLFWDAWDVLRREYVDHSSLEADKMLYGAIKGMMAASGDPYTTYLDPDDYGYFQTSMSGSFEGIGAEIGLRSGILTIIAPLDDSPAAAAGLRAGDLILKIDGRTTAEISIDEAVRQIRGPRGSKVVLTIAREGEAAPREVTVIRDKIVIKSVKSEFLAADKIGYIRLTSFDENASALFRKAAADLLRSGARALVIDLRSNPGGYLQSAVEIADMMLPEGELIVVQESTGGERKEIRARGGDFLSGLPTVVLIDGGSASASEILAGALKDDRDGIVIVGTKSFGKGSVQQLFPLRIGAAKVTVAKWLTPAGTYIDHEGISPDVEVKISAEDIEQGRDPQKEKALEILREKLKN